MLTIDNESGGLLRVRADGQLTTDDYIEFVTRFEWFANGRASQILMLIELGPEFGGWNLDAIFRDLKFDFKPRHTIGYIAIVADPRWKDWGTGPSYSLLAKETRFFKLENGPEAEQWLRNASNTIS